MADFVRPVLSTFASLYQFQESKNASFIKYMKYIVSFVSNMRNHDERARNSYIALDRGDITFLKVTGLVSYLTHLQIYSNFTLNLFMA